MQYLLPITSMSAIYFMGAIRSSPSFVIVIENAVAQSRIAGLLTAIGIAMGTTVSAGAGLFGLSLIISTMPWFENDMRFIGGVYLVYLGEQILRGKGRSQANQTAGKITTIGMWSAWRTGFVTELTNPNTTAFFVSLFAVTILPFLPLWVKLVMLGSIAIVSVSWYSLVAWVFPLAKVQATYQQLKIWIDAAFGLVLLFWVVFCQKPWLPGPPHLIFETPTEKGFQP